MTRMSYRGPTTYVDSLHLVADTADFYMQGHNTEYIIIKEYIDDELQEALFAHTKKIKSRRLIAAPITKETILKVNDRKKERMYMVRKKDHSPAGFAILRR